MIGLKYNIGRETFQLKMNKGVAKDNLGISDEALGIFQELITEANDFKRYILSGRDIKKMRGG